jgi:predicted lipoprotein with Yx(FWY)xxD motif
VTTTNNPKYGTILVDSEGRTLYTLTTSAGIPVPCEGQCSDIWPPVPVPAGSTTLTGGNGITNLGKTTAGTGVEYEGYPLFRYSGDTAPGQANGNGISSYGGTWYVIKVGEKPGTPVTAG